jgi:photosystem II stability/assembly factor-like uncharacterized protein
LGAVCPCFIWQHAIPSFPAPATDSRGRLFCTSLRTYSGLPPAARLRQNGPVSLLPSCETEDEKVPRSHLGRDRFLTRKTHGTNLWKSCRNFENSGMTVSTSRRRMQPRCLGLFATSLLVASSVTSAGVNVWTTSGPPRFDKTFCLATDPGNSALFYAPPWRSVDGGGSWQLTTLDSYVPPGGTQPALFYSVAAGPSGTVYAGTSCCYPDTMSSGAVLKSTDAGNSWTEVSRFSGCRADQLLIDPINQSRLFALLGCDPLSPAGQPQTNRLVRSLDGGQTWFPPPGQQLPGLEQAGTLIAVAIDPTNAETLYVSATDGLFKSVDGGESWFLVFHPTNLANPYYLQAIVVAPSHPSATYGAVYGLGVLKSTDGGRTFLSASRGLPFGITVLLSDPAHPTRLYSAVRGDKYSYIQVYVSDTRDDCWKGINIGLPTRLFESLDGLAIDPQGNFLLGAIRGRGVFQYDLPPGFNPSCLPSLRPLPQAIAPRQ